MHAIASHVNLASAGGRILADSHHRDPGWARDCQVLCPPIAALALLLLVPVPSRRRSPSHPLSLRVVRQCHACGPTSAGHISIERGAASASPRKKAPRFSNAAGNSLMARAVGRIRNTLAHMFLPEGFPQVPPPLSPSLHPEQC